MTLLWFHATRRRTIEEYLGILRFGCRPSPVRNETQQLELELGVDPHVYCYLGRTREQFGEFCIVFEPDAVPVGQMCPFDSGGLARKTPPVSGWAVADRKAYLAALSFSTNQRADRLAEYPAAWLSGYLEGDRPAQDGPHEVWRDRPKADIWKEGRHDWRAWTWEGRWFELPLGTNVLAWTCSPALFMSIVEGIEASPDLPGEIADTFLGRFRDGGVGALIADLRMEQAR